MSQTSQLDENCIFCRIARGDFSTEFLVQTERAVAFRDLHPQAPTHVLVIPRRHVSSLNEFDQVEDSLGGELLRVARQVAQQEGIAESGYRVFTNCGPDAGQSVFHLHLHVVGGKRLGIGVD